MNIDAFNHIIDTIEPILKQTSFELIEEENSAYYKNQNTAIRVVYIEDKTLFELQKCELNEEGVPPEQWNTLSSWLFLPEYTLKDAKSVANDFADTLMSVFGIKPNAPVNHTALPQKKSDNECNVNSLTARFLTIFPQFKDVYPKYVTQSGTFLYTKFFSEIGATHLKELLQGDDKRHLEKYFDTLNHHYCLGDLEVRSLVSSVIIVEAIGKDADLLQTAKKYMADYKYLLIATDFSLKIYKKELSKNAR